MPVPFQTIPMYPNPNANPSPPTLSLTLMTLTPPTLMTLTPSTRRASLGEVIAGRFQAYDFEPTVRYATPPPLITRH